MQGWQRWEWLLVTTLISVTKSFRKPRVFRTIAMWCVITGTAVQGSAQRRITQAHSTTPQTSAVSDARHRAIAAFNQVSSSFLREFNRPKAIEGYLQVTALDTTYAPAWFNLGVLSEAEKNWSKAQVYFNQYLHLAPHGREADRAKQELQILVKYQDGSINLAAAKQAEYDSMIERARGFLAVNLFREAIAEAGRAQAADASRWEAYAVVSLCMAKQHKRDAAMRLEMLAVNRAPAEKRDQVHDALDNQISEWSK